MTSTATQPLRLLFAVPGFPKISETFVTDQIIGLHRLGHHVDVFSTSTGALDDPGLRHELTTAMGHLYLPGDTPVDPTLSWLPQRRQPTWWHPRTWANGLRVVTHPGFRQLRYPLKRGAALLNQSKYDAVVCHFGPAGVMMQQMRDLGLIQAPLATVFHGYDITNYLERVPTDFYHDLFERGDLFLPISERWQGRLAELGCPQERTQLQRLGTDLSVFTHETRLPQSGQPLKLMSVARLVEKKGIEYGIRAVAKLHAAGVDAVYNIVGDGPLRDDLSALVDQLKVSEQVNFLGARPHSEIATIMREHNILLVPSVTDAQGGMEGIPVVIMEAMASGLLVVASEHSGIPEIVRHGETGLLAGERDDGDLAACLISVNNNHDYWQELVTAAKDMVYREYDLDRQNTILGRALTELA